jgi:hypothetical protein
VCYAHMACSLATSSHFLPSVRVPTLNQGSLRQFFFSQVIGGACSCRMRVGYAQTPESYFHLGIGNFLLSVNTLETKANSSTLSVGTLPLGGSLLDQLLLMLHGSFQCLIHQLLQLLILQYHQNHKRRIKKWEFL